MAWRLAKSLESLRQQVNGAAPKRSKASDGTFGDKAHAGRFSDHNPDKYGVVRGLDITHDPKHGVDGNKIAAALFAGRDPRLKYVIWDGRIMSGSKGPSPWQWRTYKGKNPHDKHIHISALGGEPGRIGDRGGNWELGDMTPDVGLLNVVEPPVLRRGAEGEDVRLLQQLLVKWGAQIKPDAEFGPRTEAAVKAFQKAKGLLADGIVGPYTWRALLA